MMPRKRQKSERPGLVYIIGTNDGRFAKIGHTDKGVRRRMAQHETSTQQALVYLCAVSASRADEGRLLRCFSSDALRGDLRKEKDKKFWQGDVPAYEKEWFTAGERIRGYVRWLRKQWFTYRTIEESEMYCEWVSSDRWVAHEWAWVEARHDSAPTLFGSAPWSDTLMEFRVEGDDYYTHEGIVGAASEVCGSGFDFDPATHPFANRVVGASDYCTIEEDGLRSAWRGNVWCNPPFNQWDDWAPKALNEYRTGNAKNLFVLCPTRSLTSAAVVKLVDACGAMCITKGRWKFWGEIAGESPDDGHVIFYFGENVERFCEVFGKEIGPVMVGTRATRSAPIVVCPNI